MKLAPVTPADVYTMRLGGLYDDQSKEPPFVAGHEGVGVVVKVGRIVPRIVLHGIRREQMPNNPAQCVYNRVQADCTLLIYMRQPPGVNSVGKSHTSKTLIRSSRATVAIVHRHACG